MTAVDWPTTGQTPALTKQKATDFPFVHKWVFEWQQLGLRVCSLLRIVLQHNTTAHPSTLRRPLFAVRTTAIMARVRSLFQFACSVLLFAGASQALKFDLEALPHAKPRCIRNFVGKDTLVVVTATIDGYRGDGMRVDMHVSAANIESRRAY